MSEEQISYSGNGGSLDLFALCTAIWVAPSATEQFWPVWILIVVVLTIVRSGWALYGPAPDLDAVPGGEGGQGKASPRRGIAGRFRGQDLQNVPDQRAAA
jgi:hypothetical protein